MNLWIKIGLNEAKPEAILNENQDKNELTTIVGTDLNMGGYDISRRSKQAGTPHFSPHDLRRTNVSRLLEAGVDINTVKNDGPCKC